MRRVLALLGTVAVLGGAALAVLGAPDPGPDFEVLAGMVVLAGAGLALYKIAGSVPNDGSVALPAWAPGGGLVHGVPEQTRAEYPLSAEEFSEIVATAGARARQQETVEDGLEVLGPPLREALLEALIQGGQSPGEAERALAAGTWTNDPWAAYVVDERVPPPRWTLRQRLRAWLFPEDTVQRLARRTVHAVARAADDAIPPVPGQAAPRSVPVVSPTLADLQRGADGELQRAIEPTAIARGQSPPDHNALDDEFAGGDGDRPTTEDDDDGGEAEGSASATADTDTAEGNATGPHSGMAPVPDPLSADPTTATGEEER